tara:strand:+ start:3461 stop:4162 length:702 start_codon:yes stop_codon:yes gene_type:complete
MINFESGKSYAYPFPYMEVENCFDQETLNNLIKEFPDQSKQPVVMGGRKQTNLRHHNVDVWKDVAPTWHKLFNWLNDDTVFHSIFNYYIDDLIHWDCNLTNESSLRHPDGDCFTHVDWSIANDGYVREIHRDTDKRIWNFIIFLSDKDWEGGDFVIHSSDNLTSYPRQIFGNDVVHAPAVKTIEAKAGRGCFFLSTPNSYHSVSKQFNTKSDRKFIYGSYSYRNGDVFNKRIK